MAVSGNMPSRDFLADRRQHHQRMKLKTNRLSWLKDTVPVVTWSERIG